MCSLALTPNGIIIMSSEFIEILEDLANLKNNFWKGRMVFYIIIMSSEFIEILDDLAILKNNFWKGRMVFDIIIMSSEFIEILDDLAILKNNFWKGRIVLKLTLKIFRESYLKFFQTATVALYTKKKIRRKKRKWKFLVEGRERVWRPK